MIQRITLTCGREERERAGNPARPRARTGYDKRKTDLAGLILRSQQPTADITKERAIMFRRRHHIAMVLIIVFGATATAGLDIPDNPLWEQIVDEVYLQEIPTLIATDRALTAAAYHEGRAWVGDAQGVWLVDGELLAAQIGPNGPVTRLSSLDDVLYAAGPAGLWAMSGSKWSNLSNQPVTDLCYHNGQVVVASGTELYAVTTDGLSELSSGNRSKLLGVESYSGTLYVHNGEQVGLLNRQQIRYRDITDWGRLPSGCTIRDLLTVGSRLLVATDEGLAVLRGMTWYQINGADGLCYEDTTSLAVGFDSDLWIGTSRGAIRNTDDDYQYFGHQRWIPHDRVNAVAAGDRVVCIATDGGLGIIRYEPFTLAKKAAAYERWLDEWGMKRLGFVHGLFLENGRWVREVSDNDVGYSSHYLHAKCFEHAVTGSAEARAEAVHMMKSVKWSEEITSVNGFPARSIYAVGEETHKAMHGSGGLPAEWHATPDGLFEWKGDTSSDETDAQVYETSLFLNLVANDEERVWATDHLRRVVGHIVDNGFLLRDVDGKPTRWARWDPDYLQSPYGAYARGLNGLEAFNYVTTAHHFTGEEKFAEAKRFHLKQGYLPDILRQKLTFHPGFFTHFDDRLAFYSFFPLIQYETNAELKAVWLRSLERSWEIKRVESVPWFNFIYGVITGNDCETRQAVNHLRGWPLDLRIYSYTNSHRDDLHVPKGYRMYAERPKPLNPREAAPGRWDRDFMRLDGGNGGRVVADPGGWLDAYWMGRYYGFITAPQTDDIRLTTVPQRTVNVGAAPYQGPPRPALRHETTP